MAPDAPGAGSRGVSLPDVMLALAITAVFTTGGVLAYNNIAPRVEANRIMGGLYGWLEETSQFVRSHYTPRPYGIVTRANVTNVVAWGNGNPPTVPTITPDAARCNGPGSPWAGCTGAGTGTPAAQLDPNLVRFANMASMRLGDSTYDADADSEWHIEIGSDRAVELAFVLTPSAPAVANVGDFSRCGLPDASAVFVSFAIASTPVCESLAVSLGNIPVIGAAWCEATNPFAGSTHPGIDGDVALLACVPEVR